MTMGVLKKWITDTLDSSAEYQAFCTATIGTTLNFYRSSPMNKTVEVLPFLTAYSNESEEDDLTDAPWNETWSIPIAIAITSERKPAEDGNTDVWESTDKVELIAVKAKEILKKEANGCGISGESINLLKTNLAVSEIGEADDVQASMFITFGKLNGI